MAINNSINNSCLGGITVSGGAVAINSGTNALGISTDASATILSIGTGGAVKTITIGSTNTTSTTNLTSGSGGVQVDTFINLPTTTSTVGQIKINGSSVFNTYGTDNVFAGLGTGNFTLTGTKNTAIGTNALDALTSGFDNIAIGHNSLTAEAIGSYNIAIGNSALLSSNGTSNNVAIGLEALKLAVTTSVKNVAIGNYALKVGTSGSIQCVAVGYTALANNNAQDNTGIGYAALMTVTNGSKNTSIGAASLASITTGSYNACIGYISGNNLTTSESHNIMINNGGTAGDNNTLRIGAATGTGTQQLNKSFIHGIFGITTGVTGIPVLVDNAGQLGTVASSIRYKENVKDLGDISSDIMRLRPVRFDYIGENSAKSQNGLIAEEVEEIMPSMVVRNIDGEVETVKYQELTILMLNEIQKMAKRIEVLEAKLFLR